MIKKVATDFMIQYQNFFEGVDWSQGVDVIERVEIFESATDRSGHNSFKSKNKIPSEEEFWKSQLNILLD